MTIWLCMQVNCDCCRNSRNAISRLLTLISLQSVEVQAPSFTLQTTKLGTRLEWSSARWIIFHSKNLTDRCQPHRAHLGGNNDKGVATFALSIFTVNLWFCLLYTSDAA